jgi:SAM-dependent methyltransferase
VSVEIDRAQAQDEAVTDACAWLGVPRAQFFDLARQWHDRGRALWSETDPAGFYRAWTGDTGRVALCANILDQFSRDIVWSILHGVFTQVPVSFYLDYGCGSAALSFPFLGRCTGAVLVDVPNAQQEFVRWRLERAGLRDAVVTTPDAAESLPADSFGLIACVDVLEHLPNPTAVFARLDQQLAPGGMFVFRAPWAREDEDFGEHLPEATADWHRPAGGAEQLAARYRCLLGIEHGGLYLKERAAGNHAT